MRVRSLAIFCLALLVASASLANPMVHQKGSLIVDGQGRQLELRGFLLEGWLM